MSSSRALLGAALAVGVLAALPWAAAAAPAITVEVTVGQWCIDGTAPANTAVVATLRTPDGGFRGRFRTKSDKFGDWSGCFPASTLINGGDRLRVVAGSARRSLTIPRLEPRINRVSDVISGWAPPRSEVNIFVSHSQSFKKVTDHVFVARANSNGRYRVDTTSEVNLVGNDFVLVSTQVGQDLFGAVALVPHMQVSHGNNLVIGTVNNGTDLRLRLRDENDVNKAVVAAGPIMFGEYAVSMFKSDGRPAYPLAGDRLIGSFASDARLRMPTSDLRGTASNDVVSGRCMANAPYELWVFSARTGEVFRGTTSSTGRLTRDTTNRVNLRRGDELQLACMYPSGDIWLRTGVVN